MITMNRLMRRWSPSQDALRSNGDPDVSSNELLSSLIRDHDDVLRRFVRRRVTNKEEAPDVVQDVYVRIMQHVDAANLMDRPRGYLLLTARNVILDRDRQRRARAEHDARILGSGSGSTSHGETPENLLQSHEGLEILKRVLLTLPPDHRQVFLLSRMEELSYREIGERLGISIRSVERYMSETLLLLQEKLEHCL